MYVATGHLVVGDFSLPFLLRLPFRFGQEAVMLFFLLSGFVIAISITRGSGVTARTYYVHRCRRIYPLVLVSFAVSMGVSALNTGTLVDSFSPREFFGNLLMLQDWDYAKPGVWFGTFLGNDPLWSLSYEWWFYLLGHPLLLTLAKSRCRVWIILACSLASWFSFLAFPNHLSLVGTYLIVWWAGAELALWCTHPVGYHVSSLPDILWSLGMLAAAGLVPIVESGGLDLRGGHDMGIYPYLTLRHFVLAFGCVAVALAWRKLHFKGFDRSIGLFAVFAPVAYGIYLFHYPILVQLSLARWILFKPLAVALQLAALAMLAYLAEVKLQPLINRMFR